MLPQEEICNNYALRHCYCWMLTHGQAMERILKKAALFRTFSSTGFKKPMPLEQSIEVWEAANGQIIKAFVMKLQEGCQSCWRGCLAKNFLWIIKSFQKKSLGRKKMKRQSYCLATLVQQFLNCNFRNLSRKGLVTEGRLHFRNWKTGHLGLPQWWSLGCILTCLCVYMNETYTFIMSVLFLI